MLRAISATTKLECFIRRETWRSSSYRLHLANSIIADGLNEATLYTDIAGMVAAMTESEPDVVSGRPYTTPLVHRDSATKAGKAFGGSV
jgi:hypothetical protein